MYGCKNHDSAQSYLIWKMHLLHFCYEFVEDSNAGEALRTGQEVNKNNIISNKNKRALQDKMSNNINYKETG